MNTEHVAVQGWHPPSSLDGDNCQVISYLMVPINLYTRGLKVDLNLQIEGRTPPPQRFGWKHFLHYCLCVFVNLD